jgi:hypothetical protein
MAYCNTPIFSVYLGNTAGFSKSSEFIVEGLTNSRGGREKNPMPFIGALWFFCSGATAQHHLFRAG